MASPQLLLLLPAVSIAVPGPGHLPNKALWTPCTWEPMGLTLSRRKAG